MLKWLYELNKRAPDDPMLNIVHTIFWAIITGLVVLVIGLFL